MPASAAGSVGRPVTAATACLATSRRSRNSVRRLVYRSPARLACLAGRQPAFSCRKRVLAECEPPTAWVGRELWHEHLHRTVPVPNLLRPDKLRYDVGDRIACSGQCLGDSAWPNFSRVPPLSAACGAHSGDANRTSQNGNRRTMTTVDIHRHASHKPLHAGDMESVLWGIEKDPCCGRR